MIILIVRHIFLSLVGLILFSGCANDKMNYQTEVQTETGSKAQIVVETEAKNNNNQLEFDFWDEPTSNTTQKDSDKYIKDENTEDDKKDDNDSILYSGIQLPIDFFDE